MPFYPNYPNLHFVKIYLHKSIASYITTCYITLRNTMIYNKGKGDRKCHTNIISHMLMKQTVRNG